MIACDLVVVYVETKMSLTSYCMPQHLTDVSVGYIQMRFSSTLCGYDFGSGFAFVVAMIAIVAIVTVGTLYLQSTCTIAAFVTLRVYFTHRRVYISIRMAGFGVRVKEDPGTFIKLKQTRGFDPQPDEGFHILAITLLNGGFVDIVGDNSVFFCVGVFVFVTIGENRAQRVVACCYIVSSTVSCSDVLVKLL